MRLRYRLASVVVSREGTKIRAYRLGYVPSAVTARPLLREVQQYGTDVKLAGGVIVSGTSLPPQTFAYQDEADDGSVGWGTRVVTPFTGTFAHVARAADFSGDGRTDMMCSADGVTQVAVSAGDGFAAPAVWLNQELGSPIIGDFSGDGASDLAVYDGTTKAFKVALSTGTGFAPLAEWGTATAVWEDGNIYSCGGSGSARSGMRELRRERLYRRLLAT